MIVNIENIVKKDIHNEPIMNIDKDKN